MIPSDIYTIHHKLREDFIIYYGTIVITMDNELCELVGVVWQDYKDNMLRFEGVIDKPTNNKVVNTFYNFFDEREFKMKIPNYKACKVRISTLNLAKEKVINISGDLLDISLDMEAEKQVDKVIIDVCNYVQNLNVNEFSVNDWIIEVIKREDEKSTFENLTNVKETVITHRFVLRKNDNSLFCTNNKALNLLFETIDWVCSFTSARYVKFSNAYGCIDNKVIWGKYRRPIGSIVKKTSNWFFPKTRHMFEDLLPNVLVKVEEEKWAKTLRIWLAWYIEAMGDSLIESRIVATQVALESICWTHLIEENDLIEENSFDKLNASDKLRLLLHEFKINKNLVENDRTKLIIKANWIKDGPHLITEVRNNIVHPSLKKKKQPKLEILDNINTKVISWFYSVHYLELSILYILGYKGTYQSRVDEWLEYKEVPWIFEINKS